MLAELSPALIAEVKRAAKLLAAQSRICILTGAGISAESGIPTFRDKQTGLWENYGVEDLATPEAFMRDPELVWSWYQWRRQIVAMITIDKKIAASQRRLGDVPVINYHRVPSRAQLTASLQEAE